MDGRCSKDARGLFFPQSRPIFCQNKAIFFRVFFLVNFSLNVLAWKIIFHYGPLWSTVSGLSSRRQCRYCLPSAVGGSGALQQNSGLGHLLFFCFQASALCPCVHGAACSCRTAHLVECIGPASAPSHPVAPPSLQRAHVLPPHGIRSWCATFYAVPTQFFGAQEIHPWMECLSICAQKRFGHL